jgi:hypothetical protein
MQRREGLKMQFNTPEIQFYTPGQLISQFVAIIAMGAGIAAALIFL